MEPANHSIKSESDPTALILQGILSRNQITTIHSTLRYFSVLLKQSKNSSKKEAEDIWIQQITEIKSRGNDKIQKKLQNIVQRNYIENFAFEKAVLDPPPIEEGNMFTRLSSVLKKFSGVCLRQRISMVASEILKTLPPSEKKSVDRKAFQFQREQKSEIYQFVETVELYQKSRRPESRGLLSLVLTPLGFFGVLAPQLTGHENQSNYRTFRGYEYSKVEMKEKKDN